MDALPSKLGSLCSVALTVILLSYTVYKSIILEGRKNIDFVQAVKENHFDDSHVFGSKQGFNIAAAVFNTQVPETIEPLDPTYGRLRFTKKQFSILEETGLTTLNLAELKTHICTEEELGLTEVGGDNNSHKFWPINR